MNENLQMTSLLRRAPYHHALSRADLHSYAQVSSELAIDLPPALAKSVKKRQVEFILGRYCARLACEQAGIEDAGTLPIKADRSPCWPDGFVGSITHCEGFVAAALAPLSQLVGIGIDAEPVMSAHTLAQVRDIIAVESEQHLAYAVRDMLSELEFYTLIFSAKESIYKCLQGLTKKRLSFHDVSVGFVDAFNGVFIFWPNSDLDGRISKSFIHHGRFEIVDGIVHTTVEISPSDLEAPLSDLSHLSQWHDTQLSGQAASSFA